MTLYFDPSYLRQQLTWSSRQVAFAALLESAADGAGDIIPIRPPDRHRRMLIDQACALARADSARSAPSLRLLGEALTLIAALDQSDGMVRPTIPRREVRAAVDAMRSDIARRWTAADLSCAVNLSQSQVVRLFNAAFGEPPITVLQRLRAERLASLLLTTDLSVQQCATTVGWKDAGHACRMMIRFHGLTPTRYRRMSHLHR
ncbi:AraC family transcriptional regulator [Leucobacter sp. M11]|uniref:AraC family transcriptional regulator n=1 Tax=Leucobacter sp. M11 TaxID=2993565 RepID=UPI002D7F2E06|nr:AraC family transcriptional regulator [Leucobacter sp. M11]MEB4613774.1 AraC family transcriptional regulator [Leucobacter sp. M11]